MFSDFALILSGGNGQMANTPTLEITFDNIFEKYTEDGEEITTMRNSGLKQKYEMNTAMPVSKHIEVLCSLFGAKEPPTHYKLLYGGKYAIADDRPLLQQLNQFSKQEGLEGLVLRLQLSFLVPRMLNALKSVTSSQEAKIRTFWLRYLLIDSVCAELFIEQGGIDALFHAISHASGNALTYALVGLQAAMNYILGLEQVCQSPEHLSQLYSLLSGSNVAVARQVLALLFVACNFGLNGVREVDWAAKKSASESKTEPYAMMIDVFEMGDFDVQLNLLTLCSTMLKNASEEMRKGLIRDWTELGFDKKLKKKLPTITDAAYSAQIQYILAKMGKKDRRKTVGYNKSNSRRGDSDAALHRANAAKGSKIRRFTSHRSTKDELFISSPYDFRDVGASSLQTVVSEAPEIAAKVFAGYNSNDPLPADVLMGKNPSRGTSTFSNGDEIASLHQRIQSLALQCSKLKDVLGVEKSQKVEMQAQHDKAVETLLRNVREVDSKYASQIAQYEMDITLLRGDNDRMTSELRAHRNGGALGLDVEAGNVPELIRRQLRALRMRFDVLQAMKVQVIKELNRKEASGGLNTEDQKKIETLEVTVENLRKANVDLRRELTMRKSSTFNTDEEVIDALQNEVATLRMENDTISSELRKYREAVQKDRERSYTASDLLSNRKEGAQVDIENSPEVQVIRNQVIGLEKELAEVKLKCSVEESSKKQAFDQLRTMMTVMKSLRTKCEAEGKSRAQLQDGMDALKVERLETAEEMARLREEVERLNQQVEDRMELETDYATLEEALRQESELRASLQTSLDQKEHEYKVVFEQMKEGIRDEERKTVDTLVLEHQKEMAKLQTQVAEQQSSKHQLASMVREVEGAYSALKRRELELSTLRKNEELYTRKLEETASQLEDEAQRRKRVEAELKVVKEHEGVSNAAIIALHAEIEELQGKLSDFNPELMQRKLTSYEGEMERQRKDIEGYRQQLEEAQIHPKRTSFLPVNALGGLSLWLNPSNASMVQYYNGIPWIMAEDSPHYLENTLYANLPIPTIEPMQMEAYLGAGVAEKILVEGFVEWAVSLEKIEKLLDTSGMQCRVLADKLIALDATHISRPLLMRVVGALPPSPVISMIHKVAELAPKVSLSSSKAFLARLGKQERAKERLQAWLVMRSMDSLLVDLEKAIEDTKEALIEAGKSQRLRKVLSGITSIHSFLNGGMRAVGCPVEDASVILQVGGGMVGMHAAVLELLVLEEDDFASQLSTELIHVKEAAESDFSGLWQRFQTLSRLTERSLLECQILAKGDEPVRMILIPYLESAMRECERIRAGFDEVSERLASTLQLFGYHARYGEESFISPDRFLQEINQIMVTIKAVSLRAKGNAPQRSYGMIGEGENPLDSIIEEMRSLVPNDY